MTRWLQDYGLYFAWVVALVATTGSLIYSEVLGFVPCKLCWFQRIFMYPLVVVLGIASYRNDRAIALYVLPLSVIGATIALYHYLEQKVPGFGNPAFCAQGVPCTVQYINWLGFITIPFQSLVAFTLITLFMVAVVRGLRREREITDAEAEAKPGLAKEG